MKGKATKKAISSGEKRGMGREIERKFLVTGNSWRGSGKGVHIRQGYLSLEMTRIVRVRILDKRGFLTVKGKPKGFTAPEYEYEIPVKDAREMLDLLCERPLIEKTRYGSEVGGLLWEIDLFSGENEGLILAEVELEDEKQEFSLPDWVGEEVTGNPRYTNACLVKNPYRLWR
jgi:adenylate cyclase